MKRLKLFVILVSFFACSSSKNNNTDDTNALFNTLVKIDSTQSYSAILNTLLNRITNELEIIHCDDTIRINQKAYDEMSVFKQESKKAKSYLFHFKSSISAVVQNIRVDQADTIQINHMNNLLDTKLSLNYSKANLEGLIEKLTPFTSNYKTDDQPDFVLLKSEMIEDKTNFASRYLNLVKLNNQLLRIEYDHYKTILFKGVKHGSSCPPYQ